MDTEKPGFSRSGDCLEVGCFGRAREGEFDIRCTNWPKCANIDFLKDDDLYGDYLDEYYTDSVYEGDDDGDPF